MTDISKVAEELAYCAADTKHPVEIRAIAAALEYLVRREFERERQAWENNPYRLVPIESDPAVATDLGACWAEGAGDG